MSNVDYVLTTFSPAMFGEGATAHIRIVTQEDATRLIDASTRIVATRLSHERLARTLFPQASPETARYAMLRPGTNAIHLHYRGPQINESGAIPVGGMVTFYLVETDDYADVEAA